MRILLIVPVGASLALNGCVHTPPGTSVEIALAKKASLVRLSLPTRNTVDSGASAKPAAVEPPLPEEGSNLDRVRETYSKGVFCLQTGRDLDAIEAFEEVVRLDPGFTDAWHNLALVYEKSGQQKKAIEAFRRAKKLRASREGDSAYRG